MKSITAFNLVIYLNQMYASCILKLLSPVHVSMSCQYMYIKICITLRGQMKGKAGIQSKYIPENRDATRCSYPGNINLCSKSAIYVNLYIDTQ